jgi:hypothetical protein
MELRVWAVAQPKIAFGESIRDWEATGLEDIEDAPLLYRAWMQKDWTQKTGRKRIVR